MALMLTLVCVTASAQPSRVTNRDLQGTWTNGTITPLERPKELEGKAYFTEAEAAEYQRTWLETFRKNFSDLDLMAPDLDYTYMDRQAVVPTRRTSLITDPADGRLPPLRPAAAARAAARPGTSRDNPETLGLAERCLMETSFGVSTAAPPLVPSPFGQNFYQIVQTPDAVMMHSELIHHVRVIRIGGTHLPARITSWLGDSIGRWDGDTLIVDTTNFDAHTHFRSSGERLHVVERFRRTSPTTLDYSFTVDDPDTWDRPWSASVPFRATNEPMFEYACHEGNYSMTNVLRGARAEEKSTAGDR
ncbi:MAG TPA: hypothetical protein VM032_05720 [Vicinamibacterales bacterium]|nr:hypothetical protein [Vicinamibacterales bacterium]